MSSHETGQMKNTVSSTAARLDPQDLFLAEVPGPRALMPGRRPTDRAQLGVYYRNATEQTEGLLVDPKRTEGFQNP